VLQPGQVVDLAPHGGRIWALEARCRPDPPRHDTLCTHTVVLSPDEGATWPATPAQPPVRAGDQAQLVALSAGDAWAVLTGERTTEYPPPVRLVATHNAGATWRPLPNLPCPAANADSTYLAGSSPATLWLLCAGQPGAGQQLNSLYRSADGGVTWRLASDAAIGGYATRLVVSAPDRAWLPLGRATLMGTLDGGSTWNAAFPMQGDGGTGPVAFADPQHGWALAATHLFQTTDGGAHWTETDHP
jgi:hypothetical protein